MDRGPAGGEEAVPVNTQQAQPATAQLSAVQHAQMGLAGGESPTLTPSGGGVQDSPDLAAKESRLVGAILSDINGSPSPDALQMRVAPPSLAGVGGLDLSGVSRMQRKLPSLERVELGSFRPSSAPASAHHESFVVRDAEPSPNPPNALDPAYYSYYYSQRPLDPRLPPPMTSFDGVWDGGDVGGLAAREGSTDSIVSQITRQGAPVVSRAEPVTMPGGGGTWGAAPKLGYGAPGRRPLLDQIQEDFPRTPSTVLGERSRTPPDRSSSPLGYSTGRPELDEERSNPASPQRGGGLAGLSPIGPGGQTQQQLRMQQHGSAGAVSANGAGGVVGVREVVPAGAGFLPAFQSYRAPSPAAAGDLRRSPSPVGVAARAVSESSSPKRPSSLSPDAQGSTMPARDRSPQLLPPRDDSKLSPSTSPRSHIAAGSGPSVLPLPLPPPVQQQHYPAAVFATFPKGTASIEKPGQPPVMPPQYAAGPAAMASSSPVQQHAGMQTYSDPEAAAPFGELANLSLRDAAGQQATGTTPPGIGLGALHGVAPPQAATAQAQAAAAARARMPMLYNPYDTFNPYYAAVPAPMFPPGYGMPVGAVPSHVVYQKPKVTTSGEAEKFEEERLIFPQLLSQSMAAPSAFGYPSAVRDPSTGMIMYHMPQPAMYPPDSVYAHASQPSHPPPHGVRKPGGAGGRGDRDGVRGDGRGSGSAGSGGSGGSSGSAGSGGGGSGGGNGGGGGGGDGDGDEFAVARSSLLEEFRNSKSRPFEIFDIEGHVVEFSGDQHGSRFIQQKLETATVAEKSMLFNEVLPHVLHLMTDVFGNYVIQKFLDHGAEDQIRVLGECLIGHVLPLTLQMYGCRVIQKAMEVIETPLKVRLVRELEGHILQCVKDQNGNHVIQKAIERVPCGEIQFILDSFIGNVQPLATHPYGCRVIQRLLEYCEAERTMPIMKPLLLASLQLVQDQYGNYVIQHILEHGVPEHRSLIIGSLLGQVVRLSMHKFASNVVEKCVEFGSREEKDMLVEEVLRQSREGLLQMMKDQYGNYVIQKMLDVTEERVREQLVTRIRVHTSALKKYTFGRHILTRVDKVSQKSGRQHR